jgi:hypothetical protein
MQHSEEPALVLPSIGDDQGKSAGRCRMFDQVEDVHHAFPYRLALECLAHGNRLRERHPAAVHVFDSIFKLIGLAPL